MSERANRREFLRQTSAVGLTCLGSSVPAAIAAAAEPAAATQGLRAGTSQVDVTPQKFPVLVCGGFLSQSATKVNDPLFARCLVLDDGAQRLVLMVVDTIEIPYPMQEQVKQAASQATGIPTDHMMISATHTHSGGSLLSALGTSADPAYSEFIPGRLVDCIQKAAASLRPAKVGWGGEDFAEGTHCRVFIRRPDCIGVDPTGRRTVRAMMHPGHQNPQFIGPCGPSDPEVSVLAVQSLDGKPIALLANYSMHYFGAGAISADYYGDFSRIIAQRLAPGDPAFIAMMSHGTSGDQQWQDYANPAKPISRIEYATKVAETALRAYQRIQFHESVPIAIAERRVTIKFQHSDAEIQAWAEKTFAAMEGREPRTQPEVYAREIVLLKDMKETQRKLQAIRIGELGIAALPAEVYAITGLKLKRYCPLRDMFNIELANGSIGYIPPPELRPLGGYNTWPARHSATQDDTETIFVDQLLEMFEELTGRPRRLETIMSGPRATRIFQAKPVAFWRLDEIDGRRAVDYSDHRSHGVYESGYALYLNGPDDVRGDYPRAVQFAGGRMKAQLDVGRDYSVEFLFWNGLPNDNRLVTGYLFSLGPDGDKTCPGDHLGIAGTAMKDAVGRLFFFNGNQKSEGVSGGPVIAPKTWNHVRLVRRGDDVAAYVNGGEQPIFSGKVPVTRPAGCRDVFVGGRCDNFANLEGRMAGVAIFAGVGSQA